MHFITSTTPLPPFLPYPRFLLEIPISETARLVYALILSRIHLSQSNGWVDTEDRVYCRYPIKALAADCHKSKSTIVAALADLEKQDLLFRRRGGAGYANMLYLRAPVITTSDAQKTTPQNPKKPTPNNKRTHKKNQNTIPDYDYGGDSL